MGDALLTFFMVLVVLWVLVAFLNWFFIQFFPQEKERRKASKRTKHYEIVIRDSSRKD